MAKFLSKHLGKMALMTAAALWASCNAAKEEKTASNTLDETKPAEISSSTKSTEAFASEQYEEQNFEIEEASVHISKLSPADKEPNQDLSIVKKVILSNGKTLSRIYKSFFKNDSAYRQISFDIRLDKKGNIKDITVKSSKTGNDSFDKNIVDYLKQIRFRGVSSSTFSLNFNFHIPEPMDNSISGGVLYGISGNITILTKASVTLKEWNIEISDGSSFTTEEIYKAVQKRIQGLRHIYRKHLKKKTKFNGTVILNLKINANGDVENVVIKSSTTSYQEFDAEIVKAVSRWKFPKSKTGGNVTIPFNFQEYGPAPFKEN